MPAISDHIIDWASTKLPYWEQVALNHLLANDEITDELIDQLVDFLLEDAELKEKLRARPPLTHISPEHVQTLGYYPQLRLKRIYNLLNINALVPNQILEFGPNMTVIYGANGSGKSGYARVIGSAAFTRGDRHILPNVTTTHPDGGTMTADLDIETEENQNITIHYTIGDSCPELKSFYVFDSTSAKNHLTRENPMSFSPAGLETITRLALVTDQVRKRLDELCNQKRFPTNIFLPLFIGESPVRSHIASLGASTDIAALRKLASVSEKDKKRVAELELQIAKYRNLKIEEQIQEIAQQIEDLEDLISNLRGIHNKIEDGEVDAIKNLIREWIHFDTVAKETSLEDFQDERFSQIGSQTWVCFIQAAYKLGMAETSTYPQEGDRCLLCHQPLDTEARDLIKRIWSHLRSHYQAEIESTQTSLSEYYKQLDSIDFQCLDDQNVTYRYLNANAPQALDKVQKFLHDGQDRCRLLLQAIQSHEMVDTNPLPENGLKEIQSSIVTLAQQKRGLEAQNTESEIANLENEKRALEHRLLLCEQMEQISAFIANAKWIKKAQSPKIRQSTRHITQKYNELFDQLVTQEYLRLFEQNLIRLECPLRVKVVTRGDKGVTRKQLVLMRDDNQSKVGVLPDKVLSEGEQRAVALADFMTEVALDENSCGIVMDDPVTSLDFQWKKTIANHIVGEAERQQVIVFTHDLHFLHCLHEAAKKCSVPIISHWIEKRNDCPGWVSLNQAPTVEKDYKRLEKAKKHLDHAKDNNLGAEERLFYVQQGLSALRTSYEAFIIYELFAGVVQRFEDRVMPGALKNVFIEENIVADVDASFGRVSGYIEGHSHSDYCLAVPPCPELLEQEIEHFEKLYNDYKKARKARGRN